MRAIIGKAIAQRRITLVLTGVLASYGLYSYFALPKQESPDVTVPVAMITTIYPGASADTVEKLVTKKIEDAASEVRGFESVRSYSRSSVSIVGVNLRQGTDYELAWQELKDKLDDLEAELPRGCRKPAIRTNLAETAGMIIALSGKTYSYDQLAGFAESFKRALASVDGITRFEVVGEIDKRVEVIFEVDKLNQYGFSLEDVTRILQAQNIEIPSGRIESGRFKIDVSAPGIFESLKDIENVIIDVSRDTGAPVRLRDVARVQMDFEPGAFRVRQDGERAVLLCGYFQPSKNVVDIGGHTREVIDRVKRSFPPDLDVEEIVYQPTEVASSVSGLMSNMLQGIVLVIVVVFVGMGLRNAIIVSTVIPFSVLLTFAAMSLLDIKVHQVSIAALIIALGMLVDNAIVVSDAVQVRIDRGIERGKAALEGAVESAIPVLTSTLTTVAAFSPLLLLPGMSGEFLSSIPLIVILSLSASYIVAMLVTPAVASFFFRPLRTVSYREGLVRQTFRRALGRAFKKPKKVLSLAVMAFIGALCLIPLLGVRFFPYTDKQLAYVDVTSELSNLDATEEVVAEVERVLGEQKEVTSITSSVGDGLPKFYITLPNSIRADDFGQVLFKFDLERGGRFSTNEQLVRHLQRQIQLRVMSGSAVVRMLQQGEPVKAPVVVRLSGDDIEQLEIASAALEAKMRDVKGVASVASDLPRRTFELNVDVDDDVAASMGISKYDIQRQISIALYGSPASVFRKLGKEYDIVVRSDIDSKEDLENLAVKSSLASNKVLIKQFAQVGLRSKLETLVHYQRQRSVAVTADVVPGHSSSKIEDRIERDVLPGLKLKDVTAVFDGEREKIAKNFGNVGVSALFALAACYVILLLQFGSFLQPIVILVTVPLSIIGAILGLLVTRQPLSFTALLGIASLIGIVVNNAILLLEFINLARGNGMALDEACQDAVSRRFRPIFLTTVTTIVGLIPLTLSGSAMFTPMAVALMFGLLGSTLLTMVIIPVVYRQVEATLEARRTGSGSADKDEDALEISLEDEAFSG